MTPALTASVVTAVLARAAIGSAAAGTLTAFMTVAGLEVVLGSGLDTYDLGPTLALSAIIGGLYGVVVGIISTAVAVLLSSNPDNGPRMLRLSQAISCAMITVLVFASFPILTVFGALPMAVVSFVLSWLLSWWTLRPLLTHRHSSVSAPGTPEESGRS